MLGALAFLALSSCAHGPAAPARPHEPVSLQMPTGVGDDQEQVLEGAICQGLVEGNGGDVACPEATRQTLAVARTRAMATHDDGSSAEAALQGINAIQRKVEAAVTRDGKAWVLTLSLVPKDGAPVESSKVVKADSFDDLVLASTAASRDLVK